MITKTKLAEIVGEANLLNDPKSLEDYSKDNSFALPNTPQLVVKPKDVEEVKKIVNWANLTHTALVPVSSGLPHFHGDTVPSVSQAVAVDLSRMNQIKRIDRRNRITIIEPGVTFSQLQPELAKAGMKLSMPLLPRRSKSVITSYLEREPITIPKYQWTLMEPLRCVEVVWGNGRKMWTGEAGEYGSMDLEEQFQKKRATVNAYGPAYVDYYRFISAAQGSMGIVTWASIKCEILPRIHKIFFVSAKNLNELNPFIYQILKFRLGDEIFLLNKVNLSNILNTESKITGIVRDNLPPWILVIGIAGRDILPEDRVAYQKKSISEIAAQNSLQLESKINGVNGDYDYNTMLNTSGDSYWKLRNNNSCQDIFFLTTLNKIPGFFDTVLSAAESSGYPLSQIGVYIQPQHQGVSYHCEFDIYFDRGNRKEADRAKRFYIEASKRLLEQGAFYSRPYGIWANMVFHKDTQTARLLQQVKGIFDPNNILNPGKLCFK